MNTTSTTSRTGLQRTQALILAGGRGERLFPLTASRPKPAISFGGIFRIIDFTLSNCLNSTVPQVALLTQYRRDELHTYIREGWSELWNTSGRQPLTCLPPTSGKRYRGTADAVFQNLPLIHSDTENVLILSGDHVYQMDYRELLAQHAETNADVTIATTEHPLKDATHFGVVEVEKDFRVTGFQEKPTKPRGLPLRRDVALISMGVYAFKKDVLIKTLIEHCDSAFGYDFGHHVIPSLIGSARVHAYDFRDEVKDAPHYWRDIGTIDSYYEASMDLVRPGAGFDPYVNDFETSRLTRHPPVGGNENGGSLLARVHTDCRISQSVLSPGVRIEAGAKVEDSVLMPGVRVGRGTWLRRAIVEEGVQIPADFKAGWDSVQDRKHHTVSPSGIVVISESPKMANPVPMRSGLKAVLELKPAECGEPTRIVA